MIEGPLENQILSTNPCPSCEEAADQEPMDYESWASSEFGLPGSDARYCGDHCHCLLLPVGLIDEFPALDDLVKLRGDEGSDISAIIDILPDEKALSDAMDEWNAQYGKLPPEIYDMELDEILPYLRKLMAEKEK